MEFDRDRAREAVQFLVDSPYYTHYTRRMRTLLDKPRSLPYRDEAEVLNELLVIGRQNPKALENLLALAEYKRSDRGSYQRDYMATKRARDRKVTQLEALLRGRDIGLEERRDVLLKQYAVWNKEREAFLAEREIAHRKVNDGTEATWQDRNAYIRAFWELKDAELDGLLQEATKTLAKTTKRKRLVVVEPPNPTVMRSKLLDVLDKRRR